MITITDARTGNIKTIYPYPNRVGSVGDMMFGHKYRFNWNSPIAVTPLQPAINPFGVFTSKPPGNVSVKPMPVSMVVLFGLLMLKCSPAWLPAPAWIVCDRKFLAMTGGSGVIVTLAFAVLPVPPWVEVTLTLLFFVPSALPVTLTVIVHELPGVAMLPPDNVTVPDPAVAVAVPPHPFVNPFGFATVKPAGKESLKAIPVSAPGFAGGLMIVNVNGVAVFGGVVGVALHLPALPTLKSALTSESESARRYTSTSSISPTKNSFVPQVGRWPIVSCASARVNVPVVMSGFESTSTPSR